MSAALAADGPVLYANDFESGQGEWTMTDSAAWELATEDGNTALALVRASKYLPPVRAPQNIAWIADLDLGRFVLEADLKQTGREYGHRDLCLFIGGQDARHYYYVHLASVADEHANSIFIVNGAPRESIAVTRTSGSSWGDTWHHVKLVPDIDAGAIEVYFDDMATPAMTANDTTFASGTVGIGSFDDVGLFDNIVIRPLRE
jgi:hypothetical protein